jgi:hypothetical protein
MSTVEAGLPRSGRDGTPVPSHISPVSGDSLAAVQKQMRSLEQKTERHNLAMEQKTERHNLAMEAKLDRALAAIDKLTMRTGATASEGTVGGVESNRRSGARIGV